MRAFLKQILPASAYDVLRRGRQAPALLFQSVMERCGYIVARRDDFYSPLPSRKQLLATRARWERPSAMVGVRYDIPEMKEYLSELLTKFSAEFAELPSYEECCAMGYGPGYTRVDALVLYCQIRLQKPRRYLEVGSGLSTFYASKAAERNATEGRPMRMTCIEPYPFAKLDSLEHIEIRQRLVQDESVELFASLGINDLLFLDSSHIVRLDGDVPFLYLEVLPRLAPGVVVHIHDIPFPFHCPFPADYWIYGRTWPMWWNESMLLQALLCGNERFKVELSTPLLRFHDEEWLRSVVPGYRGVEEEANTFSSLWLRS